MPGLDEDRNMNEIVSFNKRKQTVPELVGARLLKRGLIERGTSGFMITARGRIALAKLG
jgi:hypothetical protein